ncbi:hypothetical protein sortsyn_41 [Escherichia phage sortsyn]|uniref:Uncharacterized protein n=1 Tax=Escherichia phage sortsyn TaxID=2696447 RepID=A0A6B9X754_9CAUD|nr:hypothetical protein sortsyn_41 [Escherichia phage sortsyn]
MRASDWGDRNAPFFVMRPPVTLAQFEATKREIAAGWVAVPADPDTSIDWGNVAAHAVVIFLCVCGLLWLASTFIR